MSRAGSHSASKDSTTISQRLVRGRPQPVVHPTHIPLGQIRLWPSLFQHRQPNARASQKHIESLAEIAKRDPSSGLHPMTVWWDGRSWACLDGHHRHAAYSKAALGANYAVPVDVFTGSLDEAVGRSASGNTEDKLQMTTGEKQDAAWRMVVHTQLSKALIVKASTASDSQVAIMRKALKTLDAKEATTEFPGVWADHRNMRWADARRLARGQEAPDFDRESADEEKAQKMATALRIALGTEGAQYPQVMARALEIYDSRLPEALAEWWGDAEE